jgi:hypothetical protein
MRFVSQPEFVAVVRFFWSGFTAPRCARWFDHGS